MKIKDYARAAAELRAVRMELKERRYENEFLGHWLGLNGVHVQLVINIPLAEARVLAAASARAQLLADHAFNGM